MLKEIYCDKFVSYGSVRDPIRFNFGLNCVLGTDDAANSIGKSTFLMIVDFVFGGNDYLKQREIIDIIGEHEICFCFDFEGKEFHFKRSTNKADIVYKCASDYQVTDEMRVDDFCQFLKDKYALQNEIKTFRESVSNFIRVSNRDCVDTKKPLLMYKNETDKSSIQRLLKLFSRFNEINDMYTQYTESKRRFDVLKAAGDNHVITKAKSLTEVKDNSKKIDELNFEINELKNEICGGSLELTAFETERVAGIKRELSSYRRKRTILRNRVSNLTNTESSPKYNKSNDYYGLLTYFPTLNIRKLDDIEGFHKSIVKVLGDEFEKQKKDIEFEISVLNQKIVELEKEIKNITKVDTVDEAALTKYVKLNSQVSSLLQQNENFKTFEESKKIQKIYKDNYELEFRKKIDALASEINESMADINSRIYGENKTAPEFTFKTESSYDFRTKNDTGTGTMYRGLIVFDLSILEKGVIPFLVHDSFLFKNIEDSTLVNILDKYKESQKQIFIAFDKINSYPLQTAKLLKEKCILELSKDGNELFGKTWSNRRENEAQL